MPASRLAVARTNAGRNELVTRPCWEPSGCRSSAGQPPRLSRNRAPRPCTSMSWAACTRSQACVPIHGIEAPDHAGHRVDAELAALGLDLLKEAGPGVRRRVAPVHERMDPDPAAVELQPPAQSPEWRRGGPGPLCTRPSLHRPIRLHVCRRSARPTRTPPPAPPAPRRTTRRARAG